MNNKAAKYLPVLFLCVAFVLGIYFFYQGQIAAGSIAYGIVVFFAFLISLNPARRYFRVFLGLMLMGISGAFFTFSSVWNVDEIKFELQSSPTTKWISWGLIIMALGALYADFRLQRKDPKEVENNNKNIGDKPPGRIITALRKITSIYLQYFFIRLFSHISISILLTFATYIVFPYESSTPNNMTVFSVILGLVTVISEQYIKGR